MTGVVAWFTGLPSSGKTTLARAVKQRLDAGQVSSCLLDSDDIRDALPPLGYDEAGREAFYAALASLAALLAKQGLVVLAAATAPRRSHRERARAAAPAFVEIYVATPLEESERRDPKGLYRQARAGLIADFPGVQAPYEPPEAAEVVASAGAEERAIDQILDAILAKRSGATAREEL